MKRLEEMKRCSYFLGSQNMAAASNSIPQQFALSYNNTVNEI